MATFELGDLNNAFGAAIQAHMNRVATIAEMSLNRLDAMAQKSSFEVDASETGLTNANFPRATGGNTPPGPTANAG